MRLFGFGGVGRLPEDEKAQEEFLRSKEGHMGHPTAPGPRDPSRRRVGRSSAGNGTPGLPRYVSLGTHHTGIPGPTPSGPIQPGVEYDDGDN